MYFSSEDFFFTYLWIFQPLYCLCFLFLKLWTLKGTDVHLCIWVSMCAWMNVHLPRTWGLEMIRAEFQAQYNHMISLTKNKEMDHIPKDQKDELDKPLSNWCVSWQLNSIVIKAKINWLVPIELAVQTSMASMTNIYLEMEQAMDCFSFRRGTPQSLLCSMVLVSEPI